MKVVTEEGKFKPLTITIETEEEARFLWAVLNLSPAVIREAYSDSGRLQGYEVSMRVQDQMWTDLNKVYQPGGDC